MLRPQLNNRSLAHHLACHRPSASQSRRRRPKQSDQTEAPAAACASAASLRNPCGRCGRLSGPCEPYLPPRVVWQLSHQRTSARHSFLAHVPLPRATHRTDQNNPASVRCCEERGGFLAACYPSVGKWMCFPGFGEPSAAFSQKVRILLPRVFFFFFPPHCGHFWTKILTQSQVLARVLGLPVQTLSTSGRLRFEIL